MIFKKYKIKIGEDEERKRKKMKKKKEGMGVVPNLKATRRVEYLKKMIRFINQDE